MVTKDFDEKVFHAKAGWGPRGRGGGRKIWKGVWDVMFLYFLSDIMRTEGMREWG